MPNDINNMTCLDIFLSNSPEIADDKLILKANTSSLRPMPLLSWDIFMTDYHGRVSESLKQLELKQVLALAQKYKWKNDLKKAFATNDYEALIITNAHQKIIWVNDGFTAMTGYSKTYALHKTPSFLQGEDTSKRTKKRISKNIANSQPFKAVITNYKKDGTAYECEVHVIPLYNKDTTHFIAFERQVG